jgi:cysteine-rich repeat protein
VEACDDGNADDTDACLGTCVAAVCGDGFVQAGVEACDDGNADDTDACLNTCTMAICGDGFVHAGAESCDDGNTVTEECGPGQTSCTVCGATCEEIQVPEPSQALLLVAAFAAVAGLARVRRQGVRRDLNPSVELL